MDYLNQHVYEKKYKFIKIANGTFRACRIKKCTGDYWLRGFIKRFERSFSPKVDLLALLGNRMPKGARLKPVQEDFMVPGLNYTKQYSAQYKNYNKAQKKYIDLQMSASSRYVRPGSAGSFPVDIQQKIVDRIDKALESSIRKIFYEKSLEFSADMFHLRNWYLEFGRLDIFNPRAEQNTLYSDTMEHPDHLLLRKAEK